MTMKLNASGGADVTVRDCDGGYTMTAQPIGATARAINGSMIRHDVTAKYVIDCTWSHLTSAQLTTLWAEIERRGALTLVLPDAATTYTVYSIAPTKTPTEFGTTVTGHFEVV